VTVVMAADGYPESPRKGDLITGVDGADRREGVDVVHAGTASTGDGLVTAGGRVLAVTAVGADVAQARARAYDAVALIDFPGAQHRTDIAAEV
jgi:phosphoribosylamine--glycine ligase